MSESEKENRSYGLTDEDYEAYIKKVDENIEKRKAIKQQRKKHVIRLPKKPLIILLVVAFIIGAIAFSFSDYFIIDNIQVKGNSYYTAEEVISMAHATTGSNIIYNPGSSKIKSYLKENPLIKSVSVERQFPSTLIINITERQKTAAILYDNEYIIIDEEGVVLGKNATEPELTLISGITVNNITLGEKIGVENEELYEQALKILDSMKKNDLYFTRLEMTDSKINACVLDNLICRGTYDQLIDAIETGRLHKILEKLIEKGIQRGTITLSDDGYASYMPSV